MCAELVHDPRTLRREGAPDLLRIVTLAVDNRDDLPEDKPAGYGAAWPAGYGASRGFVGESILIIAPGGNVTLVDAAWPSGFTAAGWGSGSYGVNRIPSVLERMGVRTIDRLIASHSHWDHIGGMAEIIRSPEIEVKRVVWSPLPDESILEREGSNAPHYVDVIHDLIDSCGEMGVPMVEVEEGELLDLGGEVACEVLAAARPEHAVFSYMNNNSIVLRLTYGEFSIVLTGDAGFLEEDRILESRGDLTTDVLKVGHHAGANSTGDPWVRALRAKVAVASMPRWLSEDERGLRVESQLARAGVKLYRTWERGDIEVQTDGSRFSIITERG